LVFGGRSDEHEVSCATAAGVMSALDPARYEVVPIGITKDGRWVEGPSDPDALALSERATITDGADVLLRLDASRELFLDDDPAGAGGAVRALASVDVVLPLLHGPFGED